MVTDEQALYNLRTVARLVSQRLGVDPRNLTQSQRNEYNQAFANEVLRYPASFRPADLERARNYRPDGDLVDTGFDFTEFATAAATNSAPVLEGFTNKLLWILAAAALLWVFLNSRPPGASPARA